MCSKKGRPKGAKTWHKTRGQKIALDYEASRRLGLSRSDTMADVSEYWHIEPESVLRSFYRHKSMVNIEVSEDPCFLLAVTVSERMNEVLDEIPGKLASKIHGIKDERLVRTAMQDVFFEHLPKELKRRTADICPGTEAQQLINEFVDSFLTGYAG